MGVEGRSSDGLSPISNTLVVGVAVFWERDVNECHVEMLMGVVTMRFLQAFSSGFEPVDLVRLEPVVSAVVGFVWRVGVGVKEVQGQGRVLAAVRLNLDEVVSHAFYSVGTGFADGEG